MNLYDNSNIDCNKKKIKINYMICIIIFFLINSFIVINIKIILCLIIIYIRLSVLCEKGVGKVI